MRQLAPVKKCLTGEKGFTMPAVIYTVVILSVLVTAVSTIALSTVRKSLLWNDKTEAFYLAESGINDAVYRIYDMGGPISFKTYGIDPNPSYTNTDVFHDLGAGKDFAVWVARDVYGKYKISSKGSSNKISKVVEQEMELPSVFPQNSNGGNYIETNPAGTNYVSGYIPPVINVTMPAATYVNYLGQPVLAPGTYYFNSLNLDIGQTLIVRGPATIYVKDDIELRNNAKIITNSGDVTFYVGDDVEFNNNNELINTNVIVTFYIDDDVEISNGNNFGNGDPTQLLIYANGNVTIDNKLDFAGGICAPTGTVHIKNNGAISGALVGNTVDFGTSVYNYDWRMQGITSRDRFTLGGWAEK